MAEEKAETQQSAPASHEVVKAPKQTLLIILLVINMAVVMGTGVMLYLGKKKEAAEPTIEHVIKGEAEQQKQEAQQEEHYIGKMIPLETFLVNLAGSRGRKIAKINMELEVEGELVVEEIDKRKAQIRDIIIILLSSKTYEEVANREGKEFLRDEIRDTVNAFLTKGQIKKVYFTELIYN